MMSVIEIMPSGELYEVLYENEKIYINENELKIVSIPADADFSHAFASNKEQRERAYAVHTFSDLDELPYEVVELIYQIVNRLVENRLAPKRLYIDLDDRSFTTGTFKKYFPDEEDVLQWNARSSLKDLIYS